MMSYRRPRPYLNPYVGGTLLGVLLFGAFLVTGGGLGASAGINRVQVASLEAVAPGHVDRNAYMAEMGGGSRAALAHSGVVMLLGTLLGGALSGWLSGRMRFETYRGPHVTDGQRWLLAFVGGGIMAYGARLARGCTSGQALSGGAVLSVGSFALMFSIFGSAYALAHLLRRTWR